MSEQDSYDRAADWYAELSLARVGAVVPLGEGAWAATTAEWPASYAHNGILLRRDPGADALIRWGDEVLGEAGLEHRYVFALCDLSKETRAGLAAAGFTTEPERLMGRPQSLGPLAAPATAVAERVSEDVTAPFQDRMWREEWKPGISDAEVADLVGRRATYTLSGPFISFVVRDPETGEIGACADLAVHGTCAEVDGVTTAASHRGRGYGDAVLTACIEAATEHGCTDVYLTAMTDDWPRHWYARRGWADLGPAWTAVRSPAAHG
ncbi:GNAT family N-acetyltransferase [Longivirga aurantiaca]|uniref:GNAT family N-acetyltransferase n=1 Tax=Longivirga aurantiaca TaxID=1837743 RepID=A0ABW1SX23_9ACTN